ncbi:MAG: hypothetical protein FJ095_17010 [Deltaproteobacteria bacterium]|nr:hypothetical protein [Deltaproteobacteria bacterium]
MSTTDDLIAPGFRHHRTAPCAVTPTYLFSHRATTDTLLRHADVALGKRELLLT